MAEVDSFAIERLQEERRRWRQDRPPDFIAKPVALPNGDLNLLSWDCLIPGRQGTLWEGGFYPLRLEFPRGYPAQPPLAKFVPPVPHLNVFPSGTVCVSFLHEKDDAGGWKPSMNVRQILLGIQNLLDSPNPASPAHQTHYDNFRLQRHVYDNNIKEWAKKWTKSTL
jgi:ubiquitin-conjugating enzyme E2 I